MLKSVAKDKEEVQRLQEEKIQEKKLQGIKWCIVAVQVKFLGLFETAILKNLKVRIPNLPYNISVFCYVKNIRSSATFRTVYS